MSLNLPKLLMLLVAWVQGLCLFLLYQTIENQVWPGTTTVWLFVFIAFIIAMPTFFLLIIDSQNLKKTLLSILPYGLIMILVSIWSGWQLLPKGVFTYDSVIPVFVLTIGIASFKALMYSQEYVAGNGVRYSSLFLHSWRNFLVLGLSLLFMGLFFGILFLWAALFDVINISFFEELFQEEWFYFPAGSLAFAFAIITFRSLSNVIDSISTLLKALIKFLLPLLSFLSIIFLLTLLVQGFRPLWETNLGSGLILWLEAFILFAVNAVYQGDEQERPYPIWIHRLIYAGIAVLPIYSVVAIFGIYTRIDQYGLTILRCWALFIALIFFIFSLGYLWGIIKKHDHWLGFMAWVNTRMGLLLMLCMVLVNSPLGSFQKYSAVSQLKRVEENLEMGIEPELNYFRYNLGRQGYLALEGLKDEYAESHPDLVADIEALYRNLEGVEMFISDAEQLSNVVQVWPADKVLPESLIEAILKRYPAPLVDQENLRAFAVYNALRVDDKLMAVFTELNHPDYANDQEDEIIFVRDSISSQVNSQTFELWEMVDGDWKTSTLSYDYQINQPTIDIEEALSQGQFNVVPARYYELEIGGRRFVIPPFYRN